MIRSPLSRVPSRVKVGPRGFSQIELLVVIAIIAVLGAILLPMANRAISWSHNATCVSNQRALSVAHALWRQDRNMIYEDPVNTHNKRPPLILYEGGYVTDPKLFMCPAADENDPNDVWKEGAAPGGHKDKQAYDSLFMNKYFSIMPNAMAIYRTYLSSNTEPGRNYAENFSHYLEYAARFPLFMDGSHWQLNNTAWKNTRMVRIRLRHGNRANMVFLDGHVEALDEDQIMELHPLGDPSIYYN